MAVVRGNNFTYIVPEKNPILVHIKYLDFYYIDSSIEEFDEKEIWIYKPQFFLNALYKISLIEDSTKSLLFRTKEELIRYPPVPKYRRKKYQIFITNFDDKFEVNSFLLFISKKVNQRIYLKNYMNKSIELPSIFVQDVELNQSGAILLGQGQDENSFYLLEEFTSMGRVEVHYSGLTSNKLDIINKSKKSYSLKKIPFLSIKNILDPKDGLKRLRTSILSEEFSLLKSDIIKVNKLLDIIHSASIKEEEQIMYSLFVDDIEFYEIIKNKLFVSVLLPFMNRQEIMKIVNSISEKKLAELLLKEEKLNYYKIYFSKRKFNDLLNLRDDLQLSKSKEKSSQDLISNKTLWDVILERLFFEKQSFFYEKDNVYTLFEYEQKIHPLDDAFKKKNIFLENFDVNFINLISPHESLFQLSIVYIEEVENNNLYIKITQPIKEFNIISEKNKKFSQLIFNDLEIGSLKIDSYSVIPDKIFLAGITTSNVFFESMFIYLT